MCNSARDTKKVRGICWVLAVIQSKGVMGDDGGCGFLQYSTYGKFLFFLNSGQTGAVEEENVE